ncbi:hypothetical protein DW232_08875 [Bifidobacterium pseudocatenulatum]|nr:hypothetical protein DW232_08875 [Bifidobacterium pseudocatenulatum]
MPVPFRLGRCGPGVPGPRLVPDVAGPEPVDGEVVEDPAPLRVEQTGVEDPAQPEPVARHPADHVEHGPERLRPVPAVLGGDPVEEPGRVA